ncbi:MAG: AgmX/PglI C-terminal domain-containing protein [Pseudomonadota bacterium]|nr:AgmX/PglI C-terminal domain-containing protein [Pseudomonadota bacterium]
MKKTELCLELKREKRFLKFRQLRPGTRFFTLGSARDADLRLLGNDVSGIHAVIEYKKDAWYIYDLGGPGGTFIGKEKILEHKLEKPVEVRIGAHTLNLFNREVNKELFQKEIRDINTAHVNESSRLGHQIVVRLKGHVIESHMLNAHESYHFQYGIRKWVLNPPKTKQWVWQEFDNLTVQQRLIGMSDKSYSEKMSPAHLIPVELRKPLIAAVFTFALAVLLMTIPYIGQDKKTVMPEVNAYTAMIYDAKVVKKKIEKSDRAVANILNRGKPKGPQPDSTAKVEVLSTNASELQTNKTSFDAAPASGAKIASQKAIQQIRATGLTALVGRLSKRVTANSANLIRVENNSNSDVRGGMPSIRDIASIGAKLNKAARTGSGGPGTQRLAGIGTIGSGGANSYRELGNLTAGSVGTAEVGLLSEEADIQGGLDREVIAQYIQGQIGHIRYCYERQLSANPELYGKIKIQFMIGGGGKVVHQKVSSTTLNNAIVEGCILKRVAGWEFPTPKGGSTVLVSYPFLFKSTN